MRVLLHLLRSEREDEICVRHCMARKDRRRVDFVFVFAYVVGKNPKTPKLSLMANEAITRAE